jgi:hypothetical protein
VNRSQVVIILNSERITTIRPIAVTDEEEKTAAELIRRIKPILGSLDEILREHRNEVPRAEAV